MGTNFPQKVPTLEPPIQCEKGVEYKLLKITEHKMEPRLKAGKLCLTQISILVLLVVAHNILLVLEAIKVGILDLC